MEFPLGTTPSEPITQHHVIVKGQEVICRTTLMKSRTTRDFSRQHISIKKHTSGKNCFLLETQARNSIWSYKGGMAVGGKWGGWGNSCVTDE